MISWMSKEVEEIWDRYNANGLSLIGIMCEISPLNEQLKGHKVMQLEIGEDICHQIDFGDCTGMTDEEINERFIKVFHHFVNMCDEDEEVPFTIVEDLIAMCDEFDATLAKRH